MEGKREMKKNCITCEFNSGAVCMGGAIRTDNGESAYGMPIKEAQEMFPEGCENWKISFAEYQNM